VVDDCRLARRYVDIGNGWDGVIAVGLRGLELSEGWIGTQGEDQAAEEPQLVFH
jgi:hypothetical protein